MKKIYKLTLKIKYIFLTSSVGFGVFLLVNNRDININKLFFSFFIRFLFWSLDNFSFYLYGIKISDIVIGGIPEYWNYKGYKPENWTYRSYKPEEIKLMHPRVGGWPIPIVQGQGRIPTDWTGCTDEESVYRASLENMFLNHRLDEQYKCILYILGCTIFLSIIIMDGMNGNVPPPGANGLIPPA